MKSILHFPFLVLCFIFSAISPAWATTYTVSNVNNLGAGSLRQAITDANANPGADLIQFSVSGTVTLLTSLPSIVDPLTIDGTTAPGYAAGAPTFRLDGLTTSNLVMSATNPTSLTIKGLNFTKSGIAGGYAISITATSGTVVIQNCVVGNRTGISCTGNANWTVTNNNLNTSGDDTYRLLFSTVSTGTITASGNIFGGSTITTGLRLVSVSNKIIGDENVPGANIVIDDANGLKNLTSNSITGINLTSCSDITVDNVDITKSAPGGAYGIEVSNCTVGTITIKNCSVSNYAIGFRCLSSNLLITNNNLTKCTTGLNFVNTAIPTRSVSATNNTFGGAGASTLLSFNSACSGFIVGDENVPGAHIVINDAAAAGLQSITNAVYIITSGSSNIIFDNLDVSKTGAVGGTGFNLNGNVAANPIIVRNCMMQNRATGIELGGRATNSQISCNTMYNCTTGLKISGTHTTHTITNNSFISNTKAVDQAGTALVAQGNYWGGGAPASGGFNGYTGTVDASNFLTTPAGCAPSLALPEINVQGGSPPVSIVDGDNTPATADGTDFGDLATGGSLVRTFTIQNTGNATLTISSITSSNPKFSIGATPPASVAAGSSATFTVTFSPTAAGAQTATITVNNNDGDEAVYDFAVQGTGTTPAAALAFDGTNDYAALSSSTTFDFNTTSQFTIEAWIKTTDATTNSLWYFNKIIPGSLRGYGLNVKTGSIGFVLINNFPGSALYVSTPNALVNNGAWHHVAATYDGSASIGGIRIYVDGVSQTLSITSGLNTLTVADPINNSQPAWIGKNAELNSPFLGQLDELRVWNRMLCQSEIQAQRNCEIPTTGMGLLGNYHFNQGNGGTPNPGVTTLNDASGNGNNATLTNFALSGATSNWVSPGGVTTGTSCGTFSQPEINLKGTDNTTIADGTTGTSTTNGTDFGAVGTGASLPHVFTIENTGNAGLTIGSITSNNARFTITSVPYALGPGSSATFTVQFSPTAIGVENATITVNNNDCDEAVYDFAVTGTGGVPPANNQCSDAISVPVNANGACSNVSGTTVNADLSQPFPCTFGGYEPHLDVWYAFMAPAGGAVTFHSGSNAPFAVMYSGTCASLSIAASSCLRGTGTVTGLTPGATYYLQVLTSGTTGQTFDFCLEIPGAAPANNGCANAVATDIGNPISVNSIYGITYLLPPCTPPGLPLNAADLWYTFTAPANGAIAYASSGGTLPLTIYSGNCGSLTPVACAISLVDPAPTNLTPGVTYYAQINSVGATATGISTITAPGDYTFTGAVNNLWNVAANWKSGAVPTGSVNVTIPGGKNCELNINFTLGGTLLIESGATLNLLSGNTLNITGGTLTNNGTIKGVGTITGNFINPASGTVSPGSSPGCLSITGNFTNNGILTIELADGSACTNFDQMVVAGNATIGGTINVTFPNGTPSTPTFTILTATGTITNSSPTVNWPASFSGDNGVVNGNAFQISFVSPPEINVQGNGMDIADGNTMPSAGNFTQFGTINSGANLLRSFTIQNTGTGNLNIPAGGITLSGLDAGQFSTGGITLPAGIPPNGSATFTVTYAPTAVGTHNATVNIANNDNNENPYDFAVQGTATSAAFTISGKIVFENDDVTGVKDVSVNLTGAATATTLTDLTGNYSLAANAPGNYTIKGVKNINRLNGVDMSDVTRIQQHITGNNPITDPYKLLAADVNRNNLVNTQDASVIQQAIVNNPSALAIFNVFWRFTNTATPLVMPPWGQLPMAEQISLTGVSGNQMNKNFIGTKLGDVTTPSANPANGPAIVSPLVWSIPDQALNADQEVTATFRAAHFEDLAAYQFALGFDPARLQFSGWHAMDDSGLPLNADNFGFTESEFGEIRTGWAQAGAATLTTGASVFVLTFKVLQDGGKLSEALWIDAEAMPALAFTPDIQPQEILLEFTEVLTGTNHPALMDGLQLLQNRPNPFSEETMIGFVLPSAGKARLRVFDGSGRLLAESQCDCAAGYHEERFELIRTVPGMLYYELTTPFGVRVKKMIRQ